MRETSTRKKKEISKYKGKVATMNKFVKFGAGISEDESETSNKNLMEKRKRKEKYECMKEKIRQVEELQIAEQELGKTMIMRKNCSTPGE